MSTFDLMHQHVTRHSMAAYPTQHYSPATKTPFYDPMQSPLDLSQPESTLDIFDQLSMPRPLSPSAHSDSSISSASGSSSFADTDNYRDKDHHLRRLPVFVRLTAWEERRQQRQTLTKQLFVALANHQKELRLFKEAHTHQLALLEHERVGPVTNDMLMNGRRNSRGGRNAKLARNMCRLSATQLATNRALSERVVSVLKMADLFEEQIKQLIEAVRVCTRNDESFHRHHHRSASDSSNHDAGEDLDHTFNTFGIPAALIAAVEQVCCTASEFMYSYPA